MRVFEMSDCPKCNGKGYIDNRNFLDECDICRGFGKINVTNEIKNVTKKEEVVTNVKSIIKKRGRPSRDAINEK
jgi:DnaJ-class molecular chaperone